MGKARVPLSEQKGHLTVEFQQQRAFEETLIESSRIDFKNPPDWLIDETAVAEYKRIVEGLDGIGIIGDLDITNIGGYCNAYSLYLRATKELEQDFISSKSLKVMSPKGVPVENPLINIQRKYAQEMRYFEKLCGLSIDSRLKFASVKAQDIDDKISDEFGDI